MALPQEKKRSYFKRLQLKFRRRREGKTQYHKRKKLIFQKKNLYDKPKYRLIPRVSGKTITCQCVYSKIDGDVVVATASTKELGQYGISFGLTNYAAAYCVGLLCARRALKAFGVECGVFAAKSDTESRQASPKVIMDVGLRRTTRGSRIFSALRGAFDGGLKIPHGDEKLFGFDPENKMLNAEEFRDRILGKHVADYMKLLKESDEEKYKKHFSDLIKNGITAETLGPIYEAAHKKIVENPDPLPKKTRSMEEKTASRKFRKVKLTAEEKKEIIEKKKTLFEEKFGVEL
ncbi:MAG: 60S ribosomal protein L5 [Amphiamblys sp. WSBS2006]|nr:MAG: 60S ribosomal protein L5 [Amphiamblys sp. WSBS2006]